MDTQPNEFEQQLEALAHELTERAKTVGQGLTVSLLVNASGCIRLGFDKNEVITASKLRQAVNENFLELFQLHDEHGGNLVDALQMQDAYDE